MSSLALWKFVGLMGISLIALYCFTIFLGSNNSNINSYNKIKKDSSDYVDGEFVLFSEAFENTGLLPDNYTCDGLGASPPLAWANAPEGTESFIITMSSEYDTKYVEGIKYDWFIYNISKDLNYLPSDVGNSTRLGIWNGVLNGGTYPEKPHYYYNAPCSQGWGPHNYTFTIYALSENIIDFVIANEDYGYTISNYTMDYVYGNNLVIDTAEMWAWAEHLPIPADDPYAPTPIPPPPPIPGSDDTSNDDISDSSNQDNPVPAPPPPI